MVKYCYYCKQIFMSNSDRTFHIFPKDRIMRRMWFDAIGMSSVFKNFQQSSYIYLCSDHFSKNDFVIKHSGKRYLKNGVLPSVASGSSRIQEKEDRSSSVPPTQNRVQNNLSVAILPNFTTTTTIPINQKIVYTSSNIQTFRPPQNNLLVAISPKFTTSTNPVKEKIVDTGSSIQTFRPPQNNLLVAISPKFTTTTSTTTNPVKEKIVDTGPSIQTSSLPQKNLSVAISPNLITATNPINKNSVCTRQQLLPASPLTISDKSQSESFHGKSPSEQIIIVCQPKMSMLESLLRSSTIHPSSRNTTQSTTTHNTTQSAISLMDPEAARYLVNPKKKSRFEKPRYIGDCDDADMAGSRKLMKKWQLAKKTISEQQRKIITLQRRSRRLKMRILNINTLLSYLKNQYKGRHYSITHMTECLQQIS